MPRSLFACTAAELSCLWGCLQAREVASMACLSPVCWLVSPYRCCFCKGHLFSVPLYVPWSCLHYAWHNITRHGIASKRSLLLCIQQNWLCKTPNSSQCLRCRTQCQTGFPQACHFCLTHLLWCPPAGLHAPPCTSASNPDAQLAAKSTTQVGIEGGLHWLLAALRDRTVAGQPRKQRLRRLLLQWLAVDDWGYTHLMEFLPNDLQVGAVLQKGWNSDFLH